MSSNGPVFRKNSWTRRLLLVGAGCLPVLVVFLLGAGYAASPFLALSSFRSAVARADRDAIDAAIDFPSVRTALKRQAAEAAGAKGGVIDGGLGGALVDQALEKVVSADTVTRLARLGGARATRGLPEFRRTGFTGPRVFEAEFEDSGVVIRLRFEDFRWRITEFVIPPRAVRSGLIGLARDLTDE